MAFDAFLKIDGIPGESKDANHKDWSEIISFRQVMAQPTSSTAGSAGGASAGRANLADFVIVKALDKASTKIYEACCKGQHIATVAIELCHTGGAKYLEIKLNEVIISGVDSSGNATGADSFPCETVSFNFAKITWSYTQQARADGSAGGNVTGSWDLLKGASLD